MKWFKRKSEPKCVMEWIFLEQCEEVKPGPSLSIRPEIAEFMIEQVLPVIQLGLDNGLFQKELNIHVEIENDVAYVYNLLDNGIREIILYSPLIEDGSLE